MASWLSVHAPRRFDALAIPAGLVETLTRASLTGNPPHLLITGPAGVGKTAAWRLVARQVLGPGWRSTCHVLQARNLVRKAGAMQQFEDFLRPEGSNSRDTLASRTSLEAFDRQMFGQGAGEEAPAGEESEAAPTGMAPVSRLIIIEDADHLGMKRQPYLRRMMERESHTSRFIFTARAPSRIIDALRSRMTHIRVPAVPAARIESELERIAKRESVKAAPDLFGDIAHVCNGNLRRAIFLTELLAKRDLAGDRKNLFELISQTTLSTTREMMEMALRGRVIQWRWEKERGRNVRKLEGAMGCHDQMMSANALDAEDVIHQVHAELIGQRLLIPQALREEMFAAVADCDVALRRSNHARIHLEKMLHAFADAGVRHGLVMA